MKFLKQIVIKLNLLNILSIFFYLFRLFKIQNNKIICINFSGNGYGDNPKYIAEELIKEKKFKIIWMVKNKNKNMPSEIKQVKIYSLRYFYEMSTAKIWINNSRLPIFVRKRKKQFYINTWHGGLGLKKIEKQAVETLSEYYKKSAPHDSSMIDLVISNSTYRSQIFRNDFWYKGAILKCGCPRNDLFFQIEKHNEIKFRVRKELGIKDGKKIILYAPTFRSKYNFNYESINYNYIIRNFNKIYNENYIFVIRLHTNANYIVKSLDENIVDATNYPDVNELLIASDILISDYSSIIFDFLYLNRPVYLYAPDLKNYFNERGLNFNYTELPFSISYSANDLEKNILNQDYINYNKKLETFLNQMGIVDNGSASKVITNTINKIVEGKYSMKQYKIGYTQGVYDLFHIGHLNLLNNAKKYCDYLIVGINSDELVKKYKNKTPNIGENERAKIVNAIKGVDEVIIVETLDKLEILKNISFDAIFIGDDWKNNPRWNKTEEDLSQFNIDVIYLPHTDGISTTEIVARIK